MREPPSNIVIGAAQPQRSDVCETPEVVAVMAQSVGFPARVITEMPRLPSSPAGDPDLQAARIGARRSLAACDASFARKAG